MKTLIQDAVGEKRIALCDEEGPYQIIIERDLCLNYGDITDAKLGTYVENIHGYFARTAKGEVFLPIKNTHTEGETIRVQITKEPRDGKVATGTTDIGEQSSFTGEEITSAEMDEIIAAAMDSDISFADGATLHIEHTKVCWTLDVDSGKSTMGMDELNRLAAHIIVRQISLKNMGGLILIDFAGSKRAPYRSIWEKEMKSYVQTDKLMRVCGWTKAGLFELERKRTRADLWQVCGPQNPYAVYYRILRLIRVSKSGRIKIHAAPTVLNLLSRVGIIAEAVFDHPVSYFEIEEL